MLIAGTRWYGAGNITRLADGEPPQRLNRRTGETETMALEGLGSPGQPGAPRPYWPGDDIDPFQN